MQCVIKRRSDKNNDSVFASTKTHVVDKLAAAEIVVSHALLWNTGRH